jgi:Family of unknown function (DUF5670)
MAVYDTMPADLVDPARPPWHETRIPRLDRRTAMLWTIFVILLILWALGMVSSYTIGGFIHILLVIAIVVVLLRVIQGRRPI